MAASSASRLNPDASPFVSIAFSQPTFSLPTGCLLPPPPCSFGGGLAPVASSLPWLHVPVPAPVFCRSFQVPVHSCPVTPYCTPPPQPPVPAKRCSIPEPVDDGSGSDESPKVQVDGSPRSVLTPWRRREPASPKPRAALTPTPAPSRDVLGTKPAFDPSSRKTSVMICNIPNGFSKRRMMAILDKHCAEENNKLARCRGRRFLKSEYDFLYLPFDFRTRFNKGYAFVNMTTAAAARRLHALLQGHSWAALGSGKVCEVVHSDIQGVKAFATHFADSNFPCGAGNNEFLPVRFGPPRDGARPTAERVIGRAVARPPRADTRR